MAAPKWWQIESIQAKRQREREVLDTVTRDVGGYLARGDVNGARRALADAAPNPNVPAAMKWERDLKSRLRQKFTPFQLHEPGTGPNDKDGGGGSLLGKVAKGAAAAATLANPLTSGAAVAGEVARRTGLMDKAEENAPKPVRTATSFGAALTSPLPTALNAVAGDKEARANVNRFISGERLGNDLGLPASEGLNKLREKGFVGRVAATAIDQATAPATYAGGVGIGQGFAQTGAKSVVAKSLARRWAQEVGAATVGTVAGEEAAKFAASKTDNPYVVGAAGLGVGLLAGAAAYNPAATARGANRAGRAVGSAVAEDARRVAADPRAAGRRLLADEAGQAQVIPRGSKVVHATAADFPDAELRASAGGVQGGGVYGTVGEDLNAVGANAQGYVGERTGGRYIIATPSRDLNALILNKPATPEELSAVRRQLKPKERAAFNTVIAQAEENGQVSGRSIRNALEVAFGDQAAEEYRALREQYSARMKELYAQGIDPLDEANIGKGLLPSVPEVDAIYSKRVDDVLTKAGFPASAVDKGSHMEVAIRDPNDLESWFDYQTRIRSGEWQAPVFDRKAARAAAQRYLDNARTVNGVKVGLPPGVKTANDIVRLQESIFNVAAQGAKGRFWYERSGKAILKMFNGDKEQANRFAQLIAIYSPSREIKPNFDLALRAWNQFKAGDPITVGSRQQWETATKVMQGIPWEGRKTGNFYGNMLGYIDPEHPDVKELLNAVTADRHMGTAYGFPTVKVPKSGRSGSSGSVAIGKGPRYDFIESQTQELARQLGWTPEQTQAAIWVVEKAKKSNGRMSIDQATYDFADSLEQSWGQVSWEAAPGKNTGFLPGYHDPSTTEMQKMEYFTDVDKAFVDEDGADILAKEFGLISPGRDVVQGVYKNSEGVTEVNPSGQTRVVAGPALKSTLVAPLEAKPEGLHVSQRMRGGTVESDVKAGALGPLFDEDGAIKMDSITIPGNEYSIEPAAARAIDAYAAARAKLLHQESVAWTMPLGVRDATDADGIMFDIGRTLTKEEAAALTEALGEDVFQVGTGRGAWFLNAPWSGVDNQSFHGLVENAFVKVVPDDYHAGLFRNGGNYIEGGPDGQAFESVIAKAGFSDAFGRASAILQPRLQAVASDFAERYGWQSAGGTARPGFLSDAAGQVDTGLAANLATGAAGAAYGYATGDDTQDRWKRALAFGVGGLAGGAAVRAGVRAAAPGALPTTAPPRPASVLSALPPDAVENSYTTASGIQRIVPKVGTAAAARAVAAKQEALKVPGRVMEVLPPVVRNGVALLNPSVNQDQQVLVAWRAGQAVRAQLQTEWTAALNPLVERVDALLPSAVYRGPRGTAADMLIGTAKDIADHPELYDISPELRSALDDLNVAMWDEVAGRARADYGVDVHPYEGEGKPGFVYLPTVAAKDSLDDKLMNAFDSLSTKSMAKRRGYVSARERLVDPETGQTPESVKRSLEAGAKEFVPETDLRELVSAHIQAMASNAGHATMKEGAGGRMLSDVLDELHPGLAEAKTRTRAFVTNLNSRMKTATAAKADTLKRISLNDTQMRQLEKRMQPLENRIAALEAENEFGPELSYLSGQVRELRMMRGKIANYAKTLEGRKNFNEAKIKTLDDAIDSAQSALEDVVKRYESAGTDPYVRDPLTQRWYTPEAAKTMKQLLARPAGFGKNLADISDEIRAWHLAGDASLGTIQGALGVMSDPLTAAKTARKMLAGGNPKAELARIAQAEADDVAEYTFATGRVFGEPLTEIRQSARGFERVPGIRTAQDQLSALFERGSYEAWKRERDIVLAQNPGMSRSLAGHEAANMLSKVVPGLNPAERGVSGTRGAIERGALTSVSFATSPALLGAEAAKGTAELARQAALKLMRSPSVNPDGAWAALTAREQIALRRTVMLAGTVTALSTASAILSAPSRNLTPEQAVQEAFDPGSRYFAALQLGEGRSIPLGGPFRSAIKAIVPRDGVMFAGVPSWVGTRINSPAKPIIDIARNRDFQNDPIYEGNFARPENLARALWYFGGEGIAPVSAGQVSEDVRRGEFDPGGTSQRVIAQFLGSNLSPVSPTEKLSQLSRAIYRKEFYDLLPKEREAIKKAQPKLWEEAVAAGSDARRQAEAQKTKLREAQQADDDLFLQGKLTLEKWSQATDDRSNQLVGAEDVLFADAKGKASKPVSPVLESYYQQIDASAKANNGRVDWDAIDTWKSGLSKADQKTIDENTGLNKTPLVKLKSDLQKQYYSLPRYRGYTADQAVAIDDLWQEVRNNARGSDDASMLAAMRKNPALTRGVDAKVVEGVKRRILGLLAEDTSRKNWAKAHPEAAVFLRRGKLTAQDSVAIKKALGGAPR